MRCLVGIGNGSSYEAWLLSSDNDTLLETRGKTRTGLRTTGVWRTLESAVDVGKFKLKVEKTWALVGKADLITASERRDKGFSTYKFRTIFSKFYNKKHGKLPVLM